MSLAVDLAAGSRLQLPASDGVSTHHLVANRVRLSTERHHDCDSVCFALSRSNRSSALCSKSVFSQATMSLAVDPAAVQLPASGGVSTHQLNNGGESRLAFKVKSTNNDHYRLKPVFGFVEPGQSAAVEVTRLEMK